jgi:hypothetical protein
VGAIPCLVMNVASVDARELGIHMSKPPKVHGACTAEVANGSDTIPTPCQSDTDRIRSPKLRCMFKIVSLK